MKIAVILLSIAFVAACAAVMFLAVSSNAATVRADAAEEQLYVAQHKAGQDLNVRVAEVRVDLEASNKQNQQLKSDLEACSDAIQKLNRTVEELAPFAKKAREMPIKLVEKRGPKGGLLLQIENVSSLAIPIKGKLISPELSRTNSFEAMLDPAKITSSLKEIGQLEGWTVSAGDLIEVQAEGYEAIRKRFQ